MLTGDEHAAAMARLDRIERRLDEITVQLDQLAANARQLAATSTARGDSAPGTNTKGGTGR